MAERQRESAPMCVREREWEERLKIKYLNEWALSHPQTHQQPLGNKNVLSVIVNYKYWSLPYCSLLIMPNGLPLTITKPLTQCVSVFMRMCERGRPAYLRKYAIISLSLPRFYGFKGSSASRISMFADCLQLHLWCLRPEWGRSKRGRKGRDGELKTSRVKDES